MSNLPQRIKRQHILTGDQMKETKSEWTLLDEIGTYVSDRLEAVQQQPSSVIRKEFAVDSLIQIKDSVNQLKSAMIEANRR